MAKHDWYLDEFGEIDIFRFEDDIHNGPECRRCHRVACHHCNHNIYEEKCSSGQQELF